MPRTKKSGAGQPTPPNQEQSQADAHEAAENEGMAHIRPDELAGSPAVFARKTPEKTSSQDVPVSPEAAQVSASEPVATAAPEPEASTVTPAESEMTPIAPIETPPHFAPAPAVIAPSPARRSGSGIALGVVLVVVGAFYLVVQMVGIDLSAFGWPLF